MKRQRVNPAHRWKEKETQALLDGVISAVGGDAESFEKPTCQKFYERISGKVRIINGIDWRTMKSKMRNMRTSYMAAVKHTDANLLEEGKEEKVIEYVHKICPHFEQLDEIFGKRENTFPSVIWNSTDKSKAVDLESSHASLYPDAIYEDETGDCLASTNDAESIEEQSRMDTDLSSLQQKIDSIREKLNKWDDIEFSENSNSIAVLVSMQKERLLKEEKIHNERLQMEERKWQEQLKLEYKKLETRKLELESGERVALTKLKMEMEAKKLRMEMEERVKRYELELKIKHN